MQGDVESRLTEMEKSFEGTRPRSWTVEAFWLGSVSAGSDQTVKGRCAALVKRMVDELPLALGQEHADQGGELLTHSFNLGRQYGELGPDLHGRRIQFQSQRGELTEQFRSLIPAGRQQSIQALRVHASIASDLARGPARIHRSGP